MNDSRIGASKLSIQRGSKSFAFASLFLPKRARAGAWLLYSWCRFVDDQIDEAPDVQTAVQRLSFLKAQTTLAMMTAEPLTLSECENLRILKNHFGLPLKYPLDLLAGLEMDVNHFHYRTEADLMLYCYYVAGTVGLMMCHVMGVSDERALDHAAHLGMAMQMTNISRDVRDDLALNRCYFPAAWIAETGLPFTAGASNGAWLILTRRLLQKADLFYEQGERGLPYLATRPALAIAIAARVYQAIGQKVIAKGKYAWNQRTWVKPFEKFFYFVIQGLRILPRFCSRLVVTWKPIQIESIWSKKW